MLEVTAYILAFGFLLEEDFYQWEAVKLAKENPNGYLTAVILDQGMKAEKVWSIPSRLAEKPHCWSWDNPAVIKKRGINLIEQDLKGVGCRYWNNMARFVFDSFSLLITKYDSNAENIWNDCPTSEQMYERFIEFKGIGQKKASMAVNILVRDCNVIVNDITGIDVSYDKHVRQVFLRSGIAEYDNREHILEVARRENPRYPGALDKPAWYIGRSWCFNHNPDCHICPLGVSNVCAKKVEIVVKGN